MPINEHERNKILREGFKTEWEFFRKYHKTKDFIISFLEKNPDHNQIGIETKIYNTVGGRIAPSELMLNHLIQMNEAKKTQINAEQQNQTQIKYD